MKIIRMKNRGEAKRRKGIPLRPDWAQKLGGTLQALIFQQLEFKTGALPQSEFGFHKFITPPTNPNNEYYRTGESWSEELSCSAHLFNQSFKDFGVSFSGMSEFNQKLNSGGDVFGGKMYLKIKDGNTNLTWFLRNHQVVEKWLVDMDAQSEDQEKEFSSTPKNPFLNLVDQIWVSKALPPEIQSTTDSKILEGPVLAAPTKIDKPAEASIIMPVPLIKNVPSEFKKEYYDEETGVFIKDEHDRNNLQILVEEFGVEKVKNACREAIITGGRPYISSVAKILSPKNARGSKMTEDKWNNIHLKDFVKGTREDFTF